jgi:predicted kinase
VWEHAAVLIAMAGLPGAGKSSVAEGLGRALSAPVVSVDPIEAALRRAGVTSGQPTGLAAYLAAEAVADGVLALGQSVIVDAVNAVEAARGQWRALAARYGVRLCFIEVCCSSPTVHRVRLEARHRGIAGFAEPTWADVEACREEFEPWHQERLVLDAMEDLAANIGRALGYVAGHLTG